MSIDSEVAVPMPVSRGPRRRLTPLMLVRASC